MPSARASIRGWALKLLFGVKGSQNASRSLGRSRVIRPLIRGVARKLAGKREASRIGRALRPRAVGKDRKLRFAQRFGQIEHKVVVHADGIAPFDPRPVPHGAKPVGDVTALYIKTLRRAVVRIESNAQADSFGFRRDHRFRLIHQARTKAAAAKFRKHVEVLELWNV